MENIRYLAVSYENEHFISLCEELDEYLNHAIGGECKREKYKKYNTLHTMDYVLVAYDGADAIACAALRKYSTAEIEVKRVFVKDNYRRKNIGGTLLKMLIDYAINHHFKRMLLETGEFLSASVDLYSRFGFQKMTNYGDYVNMPESLCMSLEI